MKVDNFKRYDSQQDDDLELLVEPDEIVNDEDDEELEPINELDNDEQKGSLNVTDLPYRGNKDDEELDELVDEDFEELEEFFDVKPSLYKGFTVNDIPAKVRRELRRFGVNLKDLTPDEIEALVDYEHQWGDSSKILNPYVYLQYYRRSKNKMKTEDYEDKDRFYYNTLYIAREHFKECNNKRISRLFNKLIEELELHLGIK